MKAWCPITRRCKQEVASEYGQFVRDNPFFEGRDFSGLTAQERQLARKIVEKEYFARGKHI